MVEVYTPMHPLKKTPQEFNVEKSLIHVRYFLQCHQEGQG